VKHSRTFCAAFVFLCCLCAWAEPFSAEWNFINEAIAGKVKSIEENGPAGHTKSFYDANGRLKGRVRYNRENKIVVYSTLTYDIDGRLIRVTAHRPGAITPLYVETAEYNFMGLKKIVRHRGKETMTTSRIVLYPSGRVQEIQMMSDKTELIWRWDFDKNGRVAATYVRIGGENAAVAIYRSDKLGNILEAKRYDENGLPAGYILNTYRWDKHGNWIEKISKFGYERKDIVRTTTTTRKIEY